MMTHAQFFMLDLEKYQNNVCDLSLFCKGNLAYIFMGYLIESVH